MISRQRGNVRGRVKKVAKRKQKHIRRKECCHARKEVTGNLHDDVVAEDTIKKESDAKKMTWGAERVGYHSHAALFRTERGRKERSGQRVMRDR